MYSFIVVLISSKALDLWMAGCMIFVFAALGEFVVVKVRIRRRISCQFPIIQLIQVILITHLGPRK